MEKRRSSKKKKRRCNNDNVSQHRDVHIPTELWMDILSRLPSKTLLQFRCVCKSWCTLITSHDFISMQLTFSYSKNTLLLLTIQHHGRRSSNNERTLTIRRSGTLKKSADHLCKQVATSCTFAAHCHGLVLLSGRGNGELLLWNPSINKSLTLPAPPHYLSLSPGFKFDYLFGYLPTKGSFKLMALVYERDYHKPLVSIAVYLFRDHRWTPEIKNFDSRFLRIPKTKVGRMFHQGVFYWFGGDPNRQINQYAQHEFRACTHLVSFDFDSEKFSFVKLRDVEEPIINRFIFVFRESLAVFSVSPTSTRIWILEKNDDSTRREPWFLWCSSLTNPDARTLIRGKCMRGSRAYYNQDSRTISIHTFDGKLILYDITTHQAKFVGKSIRGHSISDSYTESLLMYEELKAIKQEFMSLS